jgi:signal transduction histidine kinase
MPDRPPDSQGGSAAAGAIRTALSLLIAPLADALTDHEGPLPPQQRERIETAHRAASALLPLVEGLIDGAASDWSPDPVFAPADLAEATRELVAMFRSAAAIASVDLTVDAAPLRAPVHVDRAMWERIVVALLNRALRSADSAVGVRVRDGDDAALVEITTTAFADDGGVATARRLVEAHGGSLAIETPAAGGSLVRVAIPYGTAHLPPDRIAPGPAGARRRTPPRYAERVLVVSDDPDLRAYLTSLVETRWMADAAVDYATALATAAEVIPNLILIDADARAVDGLALARALRVDPRTRRIPVLMIAAAPGQELEGEVGPDEYLAKPFASRDLLSRVASHLQLARGRDESTRREQQARMDAEAANRAKDEFIAMISHELRTPLGAILIWAQLLRAEELDATATARAVGMIERSTKTLAQLIDDLLDVSRIIAGKLTFEARPVDLRYVVEAALDAAQPAAQARGVAMERQIEANVPPISGDAGRLQQVVGNLLANAIKFTSEGGRIETALERSGARARIRVRDTGSGINAAFLPFIFERFRQADTTSTRKQKGLGLGLAIARHIIEMHGGSIEAASPGEGQGSTFTVTLPLSLRDEDARGGGAPEDVTGAEGSRLAGVRILVVDDEEDAREAMAVLLGQAGARVESVGSAADAMKSMRANPPDILLSDIAMPGEDGYALIRQVRALAADRGGRMPAAALTAYATLEDRRKALQAGYNEHLPKPVDPRRLISTVASLVVTTP